MLTLDHSRTQKACQTLRKVHRLHKDCASLALQPPNGINRVEELANQERGYDMVKNLKLVMGEQMDNRSILAYVEDIVRNGKV